MWVLVVVMEGVREWVRQRHGRGEPVMINEGSGRPGTPAVLWLRKARGGGQTDRGEALWRGEEGRVVFVCAGEGVGKGRTRS